jgi:hypothetical protein
VLWDGADLASFAGAQRLVQFRVRSVQRVSAAPQLAWSEALPSSFLGATGGWDGTQG